MKWALVALMVLAAGCTTSIVEVDNVQDRLDEAAPAIGGPYTVGQTFISHYPRLCAIEVLLVVHQDGQKADVPPRLTFHLRSYPSSTTDIVAITIDTSGLRHNDPYRFTFSPQADSENKSYYFFFEATEGNKTTFWCSSLNAYPEGAMYVDGAVAEGDLYFKTYYDYSPRLMGRDIWQAVSGRGWLIVPLCALFWLPGYILYDLVFPKSDVSLPEHLAIVTGLSLALVPLTLLLGTAVGISLDGTRVRVATALFSALGLWRLARSDCLSRWAPPSTDRPLVIAFAVVFATSLAVRFLQVRNLVVPLWVDSVHHGLISQLIVDRGGVPNSYEPFLPGGDFTYHFGFHSLVALFHWLSRLEVVPAVLIIGQAINGLTLLSTYLLAARLTRRRLVGFMAASIVGTISIMPAYYVSWGRYTQLMGMALLPVLVVLTLDALRVEKGEAAPRPYRRLALVGIALAGLILTHYRVLVFYGCFLLVYLFYETYIHRGERRAIWECWLRAIILCFLAAVLTLPWLLRLTGALSPLGTLPSRLRGSDSYNAFPWDLVWAGHNRELILLSLAGALWGLARRERGVILTLLWVGAVFLCANPALLGLPCTWLVNNASSAIALFLPVAILGGYFLASLCQAIQTRLKGGWRSLYRYALGPSIVAVALLGGLDMLSIVNPACILVTRDDVAAMEWIRENTPEESRFLINARYWQWGLYVGTDGGYWIPLLAGRKTTLPPVVYGFISRQYIAEVNALVRPIASPARPRQALLEDEWVRRLLDERGVTHVYIGARGGSIRPGMVLDNPYWRLVYSNGAVWIFERGTDE